MNPHFFTGIQDHYWHRYRGTQMNPHFVNNSVAPELTGATQLPTISVVMIDSRGDEHPDWVQNAIASVDAQFYPCEFIIIENRDKRVSIGACWNQAVDKATGEWVLFLGDDDWLSQSYTLSLAYFVCEIIERTPDVNHIPTSMFKHEDGHVDWDRQPCLGMVRRDWLLRNRFDETLRSSVDAELIGRTSADPPSKSAFIYTVAGYHRRVHNNNTCYVTGLKSRSHDVYFWTKDPEDSVEIFNLISSEIPDSGFYSSGFDASCAMKSATIWIDRDLPQALRVQKMVIPGRKIVRLNSEDMINPAMMEMFDPSKWDVFITNDPSPFCGNPPLNMVFMPTPIDFKKYSPKEKVPKTIAWMGELTSANGVGALRLLARELHDYEFFVVGAGSQAEYCLRWPRNVKHITQTPSTARFLSDKEFLLFTGEAHTFPRQVAEAMASGCIPLIFGIDGEGSAYPGLGWQNLSELLQLLQEKPCEPEDLRLYCQDHYSITRWRSTILRALERK